MRRWTMDQKVPWDNLIIQDGALHYFCPLQPELSPMDAAKRQRKGSNGNAAEQIAWRHQSYAGQFQMSTRSCVLKLYLTQRNKKTKTLRSMDDCIYQCKSRAVMEIFRKYLYLSLAHVTLHTVTLSQQPSMVCENQPLRDVAVSMH